MVASIALDFDGRFSFSVPTPEGHCEQALEPIQSVTLRVNAHTDARRRRRRFNVGPMCWFSITPAEKEEEEIQRRSSACSQ